MTQTVPQGNAASGYTVAILTVSDGVSRGEREDQSGATIQAMLPVHAQVVDRRVVPDERPAIEAVLREWSGRGIDFVVTTGGTGLGPRDVTPEATRAVLDREVAGMAEAMRAAGLAKTPLAMLSRAVVGARGRTLIVNLPGSPKGVREGLEVILPVVEHAIHMMHGGGH
ncbi:MAG: MogA/MoaB family molybdenum cofactor biosynthesis protein [Armatimonadetes bacterium]|nr:MogA/MoaB family molybdenum cofactor biosynthesis protein [Armatimonadota bacterium]